MSVTGECEADPGTGGSADIALAGQWHSRYICALADISGLSCDWIASVAGPAVLASLAVHVAYDSRFVGAVAVDFKRVAVAVDRALAATALVGYALKADLAREFVPLSSPLLMLARYAARRGLNLRRAAGDCMRRVVVAGDSVRADGLARLMTRERCTGAQVAAACVTGEVVSSPTLTTRVPVLGSPPSAPAVVKQLGVDAVAIIDSGGMSPESVWRHSLELESSGIEMVVAPSLTVLAGPRIRVAQVVGHPLLHVREPEFQGFRRGAEEFIDRLSAAVATVFSAALLGPAAVNQLTSMASALFRQQRVVLNGRTFRLFGFRTMHVDAEDRLDALRQADQADPSRLLFKIRDDPTVTPLAHGYASTPSMTSCRSRRPWSAEMWRSSSRTFPCQPRWTATRPIVRRRLLVKPGITRLRQAFGRFRPLVRKPDALRPLVSGATGHLVSIS